ncbi:MAG: hypothetical protein MUP82_06430 [Candidatus Marinimicrobia bacterium]|nr:hypothetical protein [Candidatus Neomarinimicrobiota bacterium]
MAEEVLEQPVLQCVHCNEYLIIEKINCGIFRHGVFKANNKQIDPHESKENCDKYANQDLIYGCGKPFKILMKDRVYIIEMCDYI